MDDNDIHVQIHSSLKEGDTTRAISLVEDYDIDYRDVTHDLQTILMKMCYIDVDLMSLQTVLEVMFNKCPDVNIQDSWGRTFLMHSCIANKPSIIEALLGYESTDVTIIDFDGNSALSYAVQNCDVYTLEDMMNHSEGPRLLNHYNAKGQSPYTIATKSGDKQVIKLFDAYINKSIGLQDKRHRKHKHHDVIKLPPAYLSSPRDVVVTARDVVLSSRDLNKPSSKHISCDLKIQERCDLRLKIPTTNVDHIRDSNAIVKCDSAPVMRTQRDDYMSSLSLSSPRLARRHHKQDCLLTERVTRPIGNSLPPMAMKALKNSKSNLSSDSDIPDIKRLQRRRPSISLPDLRDVTGSLVCSGNSSPVSDCDEHPLKRFDSEDDGDESEDDVFSRSFPNMKAQKYRRSSKHQKTLPEILPGVQNMMSKNKIGISPLARQRQYSTSDDQIHRNLISQKIN